MSYDADAPMLGDVPERGRKGEAVATLTRDGEREAFAIECVSLVHLYHLGSTDVVALRGVDLDIDAGELVALLGPSGTGKSTLLRIMAGLLRPSAGQCLVGGRDVGRMTAAELRRYRAADVGIVLQDALANLLPYATVIENLQFAAEGARALGLAPRLAEDDLVGILGLGAYSERAVSTLSGGEQQLAALAAGAAAGGGLLLIDEPTSQLDPHERDRVAGALHDLHEGSGATIVLVTHDPHLASTVPRTVTIRDGRVGAEGRHGTQYAVVARDGTIQLPPDVLEAIPPDTLVRIVRHPDSIELRWPQADQADQADGLGGAMAGDPAP